MTACWSIHPSPNQRYRRPRTQQSRHRLDPQRHDSPIPKLVHLNGPPGAGKSALAAALGAVRPLSLTIEIDLVRTWLGEWETQESSKGLARKIADDLAAAHLLRGHDVLIPQLDIRAEGIAHFAQLAAENGGDFVEIVLTASQECLISRLASQPASRPPHPRDLFTPEDLALQIERYRRALERPDELWPAAISIDVTYLSAEKVAQRVATAIGW